jgi:hypothetical protein
MKQMLKPLVKMLFSMTPLKPFVEKWKKNIAAFDAKVVVAEFKKEDVTMYQTQREIILEKAKLILAGIASGDKHTVIANAREVDRKAIEEDKFEIKGPLTRKFATLYLALLEEFVKIEYSKGETYGVNHYAKEGRYLTIEKRKEDTAKKIITLTEKIQKYDLLAKAPFSEEKEDSVKITHRR